MIIFGKYHHRCINLENVGVNYVEMEEIFFKISVVKKEDSVIVVICDSQHAHKVVNKLSDITLTACSYQEQGNMASSSQLRMKNSRRMANEL